MNDVGASCSILLSKKDFQSLLARKVDIKFGLLLGDLSLLLELWRDYVEFAW